MGNEDLEQRAANITIDDVMFIEDRIKEWIGFEEHYTKHHLNRAEQLSLAQSYFKQVHNRLRKAYGSSLNQSEQKELNINADYSS